MRHFALLSALLLLLPGCVSLAVSSATTAGVTAAQERSVGSAVDDNVIKNTIRLRYLEKDVNDLLVNVGVEVSEGRVLLTGSVRKSETAIEAIRLAWLVNGVREVINELQVTEKDDLKDIARDAWISTQVRARLLFEKNLRSINYSVETVNGVVYMLGIAQDQNELDKAVYIARTTQYVQQVISYVVLKSDPRRQPR